MASKLSTKDQAPSTKKPSQRELLAALTEAGHTIERFKRKGDRLTVQLTPANLANDNGYFKAMEIADAMHLPSQCRVYAEFPENLLIMTVELEGDAQSEPRTPSTRHQAPSTKEESPDS